MQSDLEKLVAEMFLMIKAMHSELKRLHEKVDGSPGLMEGWADPAKAWQALRSEGVKSQKHLQKLRLDGAFSEAKGEVRNVSQGDRPTWEYHIPKCRKALQRYFR